MTNGKKVKGIIVRDGNTFEKSYITVRATVDSKGKSISFSDDKDCMIIVPVEKIMDILKWLI